VATLQAFTSPEARADRKIANADPLSGIRIRGQLDLRIHEKAVAQHLLARLIAAGISEVST
jgi:hypothetical protein